MCESTRQGLRKLVEMLDLPRGGREEMVYPKGKVYAFLTVDRIKELGMCTCGKLGCCYHVAQAQPPRTFTDEIILEIRKRFTSALAFLVCGVEKGFLIFDFIEKGFNDEHLTATPLTKEQLEELLSKFSSETADEFDVRNFHRLQNEFFLPQLSYKSMHQSIGNARSLPLNFSVKEIIGKGAYSIVYKARVLDDYHDFPHVKNGWVAVKTYTDWSMGNEDCNKERENNERWAHDHITPLQASLNHREIFMTIWPLAKQDLQKLMAEDPPKEYVDSPSKAWKRFVNLLSALNYIHTGDGTVFGYHFDIKPHNILVRCDGDWAITDLGLAYSKTNDTGISETSRQGGNERYRAPEDRAHRNYDVWAMGCIGCEIIIWLNRKASGVEQFRKDRELKVGRTTLDNFHHNKELKAPVVKFFEEMDCHKDSLTRQIAAILRKMLEIDPGNRLNAQAAEEMFRDVLSMPPPSAIKPPSRRPSLQNSLSPLQAMSRRPSLNVLIPSKGSIAIRRSPLSATSNSPFRLDGVSPLGLPNPETPSLNVPRIQVTESEDPGQLNLEQPVAVPRFLSTGISGHDSGPVKIPGEDHRGKQPFSESPVLTKDESEFIEGESRAQNSGPSATRNHHRWGRNLINDGIWREVWTKKELLYRAGPSLFYLLVLSIIHFVMSTGRDETILILNSVFSYFVSL